MSAEAPLSDRLRAAALALEGDAVDLRQLIEVQGTAALGGILTVLAVPCLIPSMGIGWVISLGMFAVALSMLAGAETVKLPSRVGGIRLRRDLAAKLLNGLAKIYGWAEKRARPRLTFLTEPAARRWLSLKVFVMAFIIFLPIPGGNTLPAIALVLLGPALMFRDGVAVLLSMAAGVVALAGTASLAAATVWGFLQLL